MGRRVSSAVLPLLLLLSAIGVSGGSANTATAAADDVDANAGVATGSRPSYGSPPHNRLRRGRGRRQLFAFEGHQVVGAVADLLLTSDAWIVADSLLGGASLGDVANWADQVRSNRAYDWAAPLHYADAPDWVCDFNAVRHAARLPRVLRSL
jgi:hypothetical protein